MKIGISMYVLPKRFYEIEPSDYIEDIKFLIDPRRLDLSLKEKFLKISGYSAVMISEKEALSM